MEFSLNPFIFSTFHEIHKSRRRRRAGFCDPFSRRTGSFSKELTLLYHKHSTESTVFCNFSFLNCELVDSAPCFRSRFLPFGQFAQFDIFIRISLAVLSETHRFFPSFPECPSKTFVPVFDFFRFSGWQRKKFCSVALATVPPKPKIMQDFSHTPASFSP